jgi:hypothetical protein
VPTAGVADLGLLLGLGFLETGFLAAVCFGLIMLCSLDFGVLLPLGPETLSKSLPLTDEELFVEALLLALQLRGLLVEVGLVATLPDVFLVLPALGDDLAPATCDLA